MTMYKPMALCFSGLDPSGGAGLVRDLATLHHHPLHVMAVLTSETVQSSDECFEIKSPSTPPSMVFSKLVPTLPKIWGAKLGLFALSHEELFSLTEKLKESPPAFLIWDPVLRPSRGISFHTSNSLVKMAEYIGAARPLKGEWVISPNWDEFRNLTRSSNMMDPDELSLLSKPLFDQGFSYVWLKGGHREGPQVSDYWITRDECQVIASHERKRIKPRGTGCFLSSSWLAYRLLGIKAKEAARLATKDLHEFWQTSEILPGATCPILGLKGN